MADYELGNTKVVPVDKVVLMADLYNAPELITGYCMRECPVHGFLKAELFCDTNYGYDGSERDYIGRDVKEQMKVAVVAYGCNKTRLVPMDSFEIIKDEKEGDEC